MISSIVLLIMVMFGYIDPNIHSFWGKYILCVLTEVILYFYSLKKISDRDLRTNYAPFFKKKNED